MRISAAAFLFSVTLVHVAAAQPAAPDALQLFTSAGGKCVEIAGELRQREAGLEKMASRLEEDRDDALKLDDNIPDPSEGGSDVVERATADPELQEIEEELARLKRLAAASQGKPTYKDLMDNIQHLNFQRQKLVGSRPDEEANRHNGEADVANRRIAEVNKRIEAYNALARKFEEDVSLFKASCNAR